MNNSNASNGDSKQEDSHSTKAKADYKVERLDFPDNQVKKMVQSVVFGIFRFSATLNGFALLIVVYFMVSNGLSAITWEFLTQPPTDAMTKGGILPCIVGTFCLSLGAILIAFPIGVASAIYLNEYARPGRTIRIIRLGINNLAGVPSVVFGLFGLAFFVVWMKMGVSILAGALTLAAMSLPVIIGSTEEALRAVPDTYREASLGIGATKWQTIYRVVLPAALPGILTGGILGISRAAGETAPIMFTAAVFIPLICHQALLMKSWHCPIIYMYWQQLVLKLKPRGICNMERPLFSLHLF
ncbi:MAG: phosphate transport system permease protein [Candidatus Magnetoglobus multicellularis str. Araruama]|uniref:Phosphate transport system permease protein PstA n=1 Tax=Candidatus Magnetoglobus multicellularis str. Araruama TaxID=890399 RepID=A0A1V1PB29_9BACT|nr:MAG: phosphate transport system permease protein [Candidatus Magnetoglobus multicellularis str. Araruama]